MATALIFSVSCEKEQLTSTGTTVKPSKPTGTEKRIHCAPWRDAVDIAQAVSDLNEVALCNTASCSNGMTSTIWPMNNNVVKNPDGSTMYLDFSPTIADQNAIWSYAVNWGTTHTPSGFFMHSISFYSGTVSGPGGLILNVMKFNVTYRQCASGGGGGES